LYYFAILTTHYVDSLDEGFVFATIEEDPTAIPLPIVFNTNKTASGYATPTSPTMSPPLSPTTKSKRLMSMSPQKLSFVGGTEDITNSLPLYSISLDDRPKSGMFVAIDMN